MQSERVFFSPPAAAPVRIITRLGAWNLGCRRGATCWPGRGDWFYLRGGLTWLGAARDNGAVAFLGIRSFFGGHRTMRLSRFLPAALLVAAGLTPNASAVELTSIDRTLQ